MAQTFGPAAFHAMEEQIRTNMSFFTEAMRMFSPFGQRGEDKSEAKSEAKPEPKPETNGQGPDDLDTLKRQMADMQAKLEALARK
jgi:polyhydroxyalkanoate synthesis regulator protein